MKPITKPEAASRSLRPLAGPYAKREEYMMRRVCADMRAGGIEHAIVETKSGLEVWRSTNGWRSDETN